MKAFSFLFFLMVVVLGQGCTAESIKRTVYGVFQNWGDQRCHQEPGRGCPEPQDYDEYQRQLNVSPIEGDLP